MTALPLFFASSFRFEFKFPIIQTRIIYVFKVVCALIYYREVYARRPLECDGQLVTECSLRVAGNVSRIATSKL